MYAVEKGFVMRFCFYVKKVIWTVDELNLGWPEKRVLVEARLKTTFLRNSLNREGEKKARNSVRCCSHLTRGKIATPTFRPGACSSLNVDNVLSE